MKKSVLKEELFFSMTWDYLNVFLPSQHQDSPETAKSYEDALTIFRRYITDKRNISIEHFRFMDLTYDFLLDYREFLTVEGYKPNTINHRLSVVMAYMKYVASRRSDMIQIYLNVMVVPYVTVPSRIREIIENKDTIRKLLEAPRPSKKGIRDQIVLVMLYDTAIRADELLGLDLADVNISTEQPYIRVHGKGDKERIVPLSEKVVPLLKQYISLYHTDLRKRNTPFIYTVVKGTLSRMSERNIERIVKKYGDIVRKDNPDMPQRVYPHMLRRTRASGWYRDNVPIETIAVILGHADAKTTRKSYASPSVEMLRNNMKPGTEAEPDYSDMEDEEPLWKNDMELARLCGVR